MKKYRFLLLIASAILFIVAKAILWAVYSDYNRPYPKMDYVPQEIGIFDTLYSEYTEHDCRECHGNSVADRHHYAKSMCTFCHMVDPAAPSGVRIQRDCLAVGCHDTYDNGWHHNTDMAEAGNCTFCHNPNLIAKVTPVQDYEMYPSLMSPSPYSCENCHWPQGIKNQKGDPDNPGHPSTYEHYNSWGNFTGFHEYTKPIYSNMDTHHMEFKGFISAQCWRCHSQDPLNPSWDPYDPERWRHCRPCHTAELLHNIGPHVQECNGWEPEGFQTPGESSSPSRYLDNTPSIYNSWDPKYSPEVYPGYTANERCLGCHTAGLPAQYAPVIPQSKPVIDQSAEGIQPVLGSPDVIVTLRGHYFGHEHTEGRGVQLKMKPDGLSWIDVPIFSWSNSQIEWVLPAWTFSPGNYKVRVYTEVGNSNKRIFTVKDHPTLLKIEPVSGPCGTWITLYGSGGFGNMRSEIYPDGYHGIHHTVKFIGHSGGYKAKVYRNWSDTGLEVRVRKMFKDEKDPSNFVRNEDAVICPEGPTLICDCIPCSSYSVYVKTVYFGDEDASGNLNCGDSVFQVNTSDPVSFQVTDDLIIHKLKPKQIKSKERLKIFGANFGPSQEKAEVRIGRKKAYTSDPFNKGKILPIKYWSNTMIKVKVRIPTKWEDTVRFIWIIKDGRVSNKKRLKILATAAQSDGSSRNSLQPYLELKQTGHLYQWMPLTVLPEYSGSYWYPDPVPRFIDTFSTYLTY